MIWNPFRKSPPTAPTSAQSAPARARFPWAGAPDEIACNFAYGDLVANLERAVEIDGRVHAETYVAAAGAIAGFAAQRALFARGVASGLHVATTKSGAKFYFGDPLNDTLLSRTPAEAPLRLWPMAAGAAIGAGLPEAELPGLEAMFAHVASIIGAESGATHSIGEDHSLQAPFDAILKRVWPLARKCFDGELSGASMPVRQTVSQPMRPVVAAWAANAFIGRVKGVLAPRLALTILMESAIYCGKIDPRTIEGE